MPKFLYTIDSDKVPPETLQRVRTFIKVGTKEGWMKLNKSEEPQKSSKTLNRNYSNEFEKEIWLAIPAEIRKGQSKPKANAEYIAAIKRGHTHGTIKKALPEYILTQLKRIKADPDAERLHLLRWFSEDRFLECQSSDPTKAKLSKSDIAIKELSDALGKPIKLPERILILQLIEDGDTTLEHLIKHAHTWKDGEIAEWLKKVI